MAVRDLSSDFLAARTAPPAVPPAFLTRPRLHRLLDAIGTVPVTVLSAGPGWSKTVAAASWASTARAGSRAAVPPVAWLTLDEQDNDFQVFADAVLAALRTAGAAPTATAAAATDITDLAAGDVTGRLTAAINAVPAGTVLILADLHVITDPTVLDYLTQLTKRDPPLHLMLPSRIDPVLPLHRLRIDDRLSEIRAADLAFTPTRPRRCWSPWDTACAATTCGCWCTAPKGGPPGCGWPRCS